MGSLYFRSSDFDSLPKSNCNLSNQTTISAIRLQSQHSVRNLHNQSAISAIRLQSSCIAVWLCRLQFDCGDCSLIVKIAVKLWRLQSFYADCCLIVEIAVWLWRLQSDCWDCCLIAEIAVWLQKFGNLHIQLVIQRRVGDCNLHNPTAISTIQLQSQQSDCKSSSTYIYSWSIPRRVGDCNLHNPTAISAIQLQSKQSDCNLHNQTAISTIND